MGIRHARNDIERQVPTLLRAFFSDCARTKTVLSAGGGSVASFRRDKVSVCSSSLRAHRNDQGRIESGVLRRLWPAPQRSWQLPQLMENHGRLLLSYRSILWGKQQRLRGTLTRLSVTAHHKDGAHARGQQHQRDDEQGCGRHSAARRQGPERGGSRFLWQVGA